MIETPRIKIPLIIVFLVSLTSATHAKAGICDRIIKEMGLRGKIFGDHENPQGAFYVAASAVTQPILDAAEARVNRLLDIANESEANPLGAIRDTLIRLKKTEGRSDITADDAYPQSAWFATFTGRQLEALLNTYGLSESEIERSSKDLRAFEARNEARFLPRDSEYPMAYPERVVIWQILRALTTRRSRRVLEEESDFLADYVLPNRSPARPFAIRTLSTVGYHIDLMVSTNEKNEAILDILVVRNSSAYFSGFVGY